MSASEPYRHTQIGWVILVASLLPLLAFLPIVLLPGSRSVVLIAWAVMLVLASLFATLTVRVDDQRISLRFGIGLLCRRIELANLSAFAIVENPWYWGWGIRRYPGGKLYNVSGSDAVELVLHNNERVRIGTDEPAALCAALQVRLGRSAPVADSPLPARPSHRKLLLAALLSAIALFGVTITIFLLQTRPVTLRITPTTIQEDELFYGETYPVSEVQRIELSSRLPNILRRTNAFAAGEMLRGWFLLDQLGYGKLFIEVRRPPFVLIRLRNSFVVVNYASPERTRRLYDELRQQFPDLASE